MAELGTLETVELRTVWPKETDFSAWLAEHVEILNEQLVCEIEPGSVRQEVSAWGGSIRVDLLGDATFPDASKRFKVIVENQLEATDGDHLDGMLQYAAAFDARVAIWIAGHAGPGHVEAVRWLDEHTTDVDFYLFTIALKRIGDSRPAPVLTRVVGPDPRRPGEHGARCSDPERDRKIRDWYARVLPKVAEACRGHGLWQGLQPTARIWQRQVARDDLPVEWAIYVEPGRSSVSIYVPRGEEGAICLDHLEEHRSTIEETFGSPLEWGKSRGYTWITWYVPDSCGYDGDDVVRLEAEADQVAAAMQRLIAASKGVIDRIVIDGT